MFPQAADSARCQVLAFHAVCGFLYASAFCDLRVGLPSRDVTTSLQKRMTAARYTLSSVSDLARSSAPYCCRTHSYRAQRAPRRATERIHSHPRYLSGPDPVWRRGKGCSKEGCKRAEQDVKCKQTGEPPPAHGPSPLRRQQVNFRLWPTELSRKPTSPLDAVIPA